MRDVEAFCDLLLFIVQPGVGGDHISQVGSTVTLSEKFSLTYHGVLLCLDIKSFTRS
jgi:hypothetical protein